jgi:DnaK suppressor protein
MASKNAKKKKKVLPVAKRKAPSKAKAKPAPKAKAKASKPLSKVSKVSKKPAKPVKASKPAPSKPKPAKVAAPKAALKAKVTPKKEAPVPERPAIRPPPFPIKAPKNKISNGFRPTEAVAAAVRLKFGKKFLDGQKKKLMDLRDHVLDQMQGVAQDSLRSRPEGSEASAFGMHQADAGSDAYEKDFALSLLSQEQDALYEIEEAIKRLGDGTYGVCEVSGKQIPEERLDAIPFARFTVECATQLEKENRGRRRWESASPFMDTAESMFEEEAEESDDEDRSKLKD